MKHRVLVFCLLLLPVAAARADKETDARDLLNQGVTLINTGQLETGRAALLKAHQLVPDKANPVYWLGIVEELQGNYAEAAMHLDEFLRKVPASDARVANAAALRDRCRAHLRPRLGAVEIATTPAGAELRLDDEKAQPIGESPRRLDGLTVGAHLLHARKEGFAATTRSFAVKENETVTVEVTLEPLGSAQSEHKVDKLPETAAGATTTTPAATTAATGSGGGRGLIIAGVVIAAVGAALAGAAIYCNVRTADDLSQTANKFRTGGTWTAEDQAVDDDQRRSAIATGVLYAAAGVAVIAGIIVAATGAAKRGADKASRAALFAAPARGGGAVAWRVEF